MGLDGPSGSAPETQKLNFEEQPDSRVRMHERASDSCSRLSLVCRGGKIADSPSSLQKPRGNWGGQRVGSDLEPRLVRLLVLSNGKDVVTTEGWLFRWQRVEIRPAASP